MSGAAQQRDEVIPIPPSTYMVERVLARRPASPSSSTRCGYLFLTMWTGFPGEDTWEPESSFYSSCMIDEYWQRERERLRQQVGWSDEEVDRQWKLEREEMRKRWQEKRKQRRSSGPSSSSSRSKPSASSSSGGTTVPKRRGRPPKIRQPLVQQQQQAEEGQRTESQPAAESEEKDGGAEGSSGVSEQQAAPSGRVSPSSPCARCTGRQR